ncbi:hypothetical protein ABVK25_004793 [Lepraria finkii]|uniref:Uncharacterized protein n=1 Tax=Lepraria finkii TaxID=1340010 RepID=A0ABR4BAT4_9LECA
MRLRNLATASLFLLGTYLSQVQSATIPTPLSSLFQPISSSSQTNITSNINGRDPRFQIKPVYHSIDLSKTSIFMNTIDLLATLAVKDYYGQIPYTTTSIPGYADVKIEIRPREPAQTVQTRFAVWCVYDAIYSMQIDEMFKNSVFGCIWKGNLIAWVWFEDSRIGTNQTLVQSFTGPASGTLLDLNGTSPVLPTEKPEENKTNVDVNPSIADFELIMSFFSAGRPLSQEEVFFTVLATLQDAAQYDDRDIVQPFEIGVRAYPCRIEMEKADASGLTAPPTFEWKWVVQAARQIPVWMFEHRFWESFFTIEVNGFVVGQGSIKQIY